jgi:hypothetical protein
MHLEGGNGLNRREKNMQDAYKIIVKRPGVWISGRSLAQHASWGSNPSTEKKIKK